MSNRCFIASQIYVGNEENHVWSSIQASSQKFKGSPKKKKTDVEENLKQNPKSCLHIFHLQQNVKNTLRVPSTHKMEVACTEAIHNMKVQTIWRGTILNENYFTWA